MKKLVLALLFVSGYAFAQDMKVTNGNFAFLKDQTKINVVFDYSDFTLMKDNKTEAQYVEDRINDLNEKGGSKGDIWKKKWTSAKETIWNLKFLELANHIYFKEHVDVAFQEDFKNVPYTLIVKTVWIYPGWDAGVMKQAAKVSTILKFVETNNQENVMLEITSNEAPGDQYGNNFSNESRIGEGYAKTAKSMAKLLLRNAYK
ncbi:hypothetical protein [Flavobacterium agrisoli]|uniref:GLPGLI family protein n=1 Tax=Flavobacterium agrisoli TaxID=2793066 RepID=A0A934UJ39_9FLAO|nr:hypothetical protein [Flavobacterium agrisoli]MBK0369512.1 hypothetical protein [Flavobacterium agrisoli]